MAWVNEQHMLISGWTVPVRVCFSVMCRQEGAGVWAVPVHWGEYNRLLCWCRRSDVRIQTRLLFADVFRSSVSSWWRRTNPSRPSAGGNPTCSSCRYRMTHPTLFRAMVLSASVWCFLMDVWLVCQTFALEKMDWPKHYSSEKVLVLMTYTELMNRKHGRDSQAQIQPIRWPHIH